MRPLEPLDPPWTSLNRNSDSCQPLPRSRGTCIDSRNPPETTDSTILVIFSIKPSGISSQASQPQLGNGSVRQEPNLKCRPGKSVNATTIPKEAGGWSGLRVMRDESYGSTGKSYPGQFVVHIVYI